MSNLQQLRMAAAGAPNPWLQSLPALQSVALRELSSAVLHSASFGFALVDKAKMPHKIWQECIDCIHFPDCGEEAMILVLTDSVLEQAGAA